MTHGAYHEDHPLPAVIMHWVHLVSMGVLVFTGFYIHWPFRFPWMTMGVAQYLHFIFMYIVMLDLAVRVYWAFFGGGSSLEKGMRDKEQDFRNFGPQAANRGQLAETVKYYLFLRKTHPRTGKFNSLQKGTYVFWAFLLLAQGYTGFAIYGPTYDWSFFQAGTTLVGGLMAMRTIHYLIMWVFILTTMIHVYLSVAEDAEAVPLMFLYRESPATKDR
jgi:Ni/Fe-hydrogenase 1 B-type cytochrome subunit